MQKRNYLIILKSLFGKFQWSFLPPLMVYMAAGIASLTGIVGTFFVKEYLGLSAVFLAGLGFWAGLPWALKLPLGHLVDIIWRFKAWMIIFGALILGCSSVIMLMLILERDAMDAIAPIESWFVLSTILAPIGYVLQDVVADGMTVEAIPTSDKKGQAFSRAQIKGMHITMQTLGRIAIIGGSLLVAIINILVFADVETLNQSEKLAAYSDVYLYSLFIPVISVSGVGLSFIQQKLKRLSYQKIGMSPQLATELTSIASQGTRPDWIILIGSALFVIFSVGVGLSQLSMAQEIVFIGSLLIIVFLLNRLMKELDPEARSVLAGTAIIVFVFRSMPGPGAGVSWFEIDQLGFDQQFFSVLSFIAASLTIFGIIVLRPLMANNSMAKLIIVLSLAGGVFYLPSIGLFYGLHTWTESLTGGFVNARFIAIINTSLESPLGQVSMIPILAWIARSAPAHLKATFFAVLASFTNLALSASNLATKYLNQVFIITREVKNKDGTIKVTANYDDLGLLLITVALLVLILPILVVLVVQKGRLASNI